MPGAPLISVVAPTDHGDNCGTGPCLKGSETLNKDMSTVNMVVKYCRSGLFCVAVLDIGGGAQGTAQAAVNAAQALANIALSVIMAMEAGGGACHDSTCYAWVNFSVAHTALTAAQLALTAAQLALTAAQLALTAATTANQAASGGGPASVSWRVLNKTCN